MRWLLILLVTLSSAPALAFEGEIDAKSLGDSPHQAQFSVYTSNAGDVRLDTSAQDKRGKTQRVTYIKPAKGKYDYMLMHEQKQGMKLPKGALTRMAQVAGSLERDERPKVRIENLGSAMVAGQATRHVRVTDEDSGDSAEFWLSDAYPQDLWLKVFAVEGVGGQSPTRHWTRLAEAYRGFKPGFIMKMVTRPKRGPESGLEVTRIEEKKLGGKAFAIPPDYEIMTMPDMSQMGPR